MIITEFSLNLHQELALFIKLPDKNYSYEDFKDKIAVVTGAAIVNISSSRDRMSQPQTESYTAAKGGIITGENICIDGGMTRQMIYHGDNGWKLEATNTQ